MSVRTMNLRTVAGWRALAIFALTTVGLALGLGGCADADVDRASGNQVLGQSNAAQAPVEPRDLRDFFEVEHNARAQATAAEIAQSKIERAHDACGPCRSRACRMLCILGEDYERASQRPQSDDDDCLMCGRETGFLPRPRLQHEVIGFDRVAFRWDPVEGAARYVLTGVRWQDADIMTSAESWEWGTVEHAQLVTLEAGNGYTFSLVAYSQNGEQRSLPSNPVDIDL